MRTLGEWRTVIVRGAVLCLIIGVLIPGLSGCNQKGGGRGRVRAPGSPVDPDDLVGRWKFALLQFPMEVDFCLLDITHSKNKYDVKLVVDKEHPLTGIKVVSSDIKDDGQVTLNIDAMGKVGNFQGRLDGEAIWGTVLFPKEQFLPAKLELTELKALDPSKEPEHMSGVPDYMNAINSSDKYVALKDFVEKPESNRSPVLIEAYGRMAQYIKSEVPPEQIPEFTENYRKAIAVWGPRLAPTVDLEVSRALAYQKIEPELARKLLTQAEKQITDDFPLDWKIRLADNWCMLGDHAHALKLVEPLRVAHPTQPFVTLVYARAKELAKDHDVALREYAGLAILPQFERLLAEREQGDPALVLPRQVAARLWKEKHGDSTKGLDEFLKTAYDAQMKLYVPERKVTKRPPQAQVILAELITGSGCNPCVPMDVAGEALRRAFSTQELIVIRYHTHSPLPDPLANEQSMNRKDYYGVKGTPELRINGQFVVGVAGTIMQAADLARNLGVGIESEFTKTSPVEIKLSATRTGDDIAIKAAVSGIQTSDNDPRLILVLIENEVEFQAINGIRLHNGVARDFPGGPAGVKLKPGPEVEFTQSVSLTKVRADLSGHLKQFEDQMGREFPAKPMELKQLQVVAIVQNRQSTSYMQSKLVDVTDATPKPDAPAP